MTKSSFNVGPVNIFFDYFYTEIIILAQSLHNQFQDGH